VWLHFALLCITGAGEGGVVAIEMGGPFACEKRRELAVSLEDNVERGCLMDDRKGE